MSWLEAEIISFCVASCSHLGFVSQMPQFPTLEGAQAESVVFGGGGILLKFGFFSDVITPSMMVSILGLSY